MTPPKNLTEMILFIELRKKIVLEYADKAKEFKLISDNVKILGKTIISTTKTSYFLKYFQILSDFRTRFSIVSFTY